MEKPDKYYFAYGININEAYMNARCGSENFSTVGFAFLLDYEQIIGGGKPADARWGGGVYGVIPGIGKVVFGICYRVNDEALAGLDVAENAAPASDPKIYERKHVEIFAGGVKYKAFTYVATDFFIKTQNENLSVKYRDEIFAGFHRHLMRQTQQADVDLKTISSMKYLEKLQKETERYGRLFRTLAKGIVISIPIVIGVLVYFTTYLELYTGIFLLSVITVFFGILAKMLFNEGAAFGARAENSKI